uniref:Complex 1 LYR protein domain-containing protein n=1 Tax=Percolomonas cosmopolitus TaxID=63605 RepID=A0A7S1PK70_9EUKA
MSTPLKFTKKAPPSHITYLNRKFRIQQSIFLYRRILRLTSQMTHYDENGVAWRDILRFSARKEFEASKEERDEEVLARALFTAQMAIDDFEEKFLRRQNDLEERQKEAEEVVLGKSQRMSRERAERILKGEDVEERVKMMHSNERKTKEIEERKEAGRDGRRRHQSSGVLFDAQGNEL